MFFHFHVRRDTRSKSIKYVWFIPRRKANGNTINIFSQQDTVFNSFFCAVRNKEIRMFIKNKPEMIDYMQGFYKLILNP